MPLNKKNEELLDEIFEVGQKKEVQIPLITVGVLAGVALIASLLITKEDRKVKKMQKNLAKSYRRSKKDFDKKANKLLKELEDSVSDVYEEAQDSAEDLSSVFKSKGLSLKDSAVNTTKDALGNVTDRLEDLLDSIKN